MNQCRMTLKPYGEGRLVSRMDVTLQFDALERAAGSELCRVQLSTVSIPGCDPEGFRVRDRQGEAPYTTSELSSYPYEHKIYCVERALLDDVCIAYTVRPRPYRPGDTCGPYFDFKTEEGGANTAGLSVLPQFEGYEGEIALRWDMSAMPEGSFGISTWGEGNLVRTGSFEDLRQCYYAMGQLHSITDGDFGFYWLGCPNFDVAAIAEYTQKLYAVMAPFFRDTESTYRIFLRKDPYQKSGGTALLRSYMFGWCEAQPVSVKEKQNILAHEMVHNWPTLNDNPYGITTWYSEGTAEYYSIMLPLRAGLITREVALSELQRRTDSYYTNPTRHMENLEAAKICWQDRRAQRLPYGRGIFFLANTDVRIREATDSRRSIDDVVLSLLERARAGKPLGNEVFLETVKEISGLDVSGDWEIMRTGGHFAPLNGSFDGHFLVDEVPAVEDGTGKSAVSYRWSLL